MVLSDGQGYGGPVVDERPSQNAEQISQNQERLDDVTNTPSNPTLAGPRGLVLTHALTDGEQQLVAARSGAGDSTTVTIYQTHEEFNVLVNFFNGEGSVYVPLKFDLPSDANQAGLLEPMSLEHYNGSAISAVPLSIRNVSEIPVGGRLVPDRNVPEYTAFHIAEQNPNWQFTGTETDRNHYSRFTSITFEFDGVTRSYAWYVIRGRPIGGSAVYQFSYAKP